MVMFRIFRFMFIRRLGLCWMSQTVGLISSMVVNLAIAFRWVQLSFEVENDVKVIIFFGEFVKVIIFNMVKVSFSCLIVGYKIFFM
jgi:hypothetical protein